MPSALASDIGAHPLHQALNVPFKLRFERPVPFMSTWKVTLKADALENIPVEMISRASNFLNISLILSSANID